jgi:hypothetical protein
MKLYRRFKKRYRALHLLIISFALVLAWWGLWGILDAYLLPHLRLWGYLAALGIAFIILYLDYNVKELD